MKTLILIALTLFVIGCSDDPQPESLIVGKYDFSAAYLKTYSNGYQGIVDVMVTFTVEKIDDSYLAKIIETQYSNVGSHNETVQLLDPGNDSIRRTIVKWDAGQSFQVEVDISGIKITKTDNEYLPVIESLGVIVNGDVEFSGDDSNVYVFFNK